MSLVKAVRSDIFFLSVTALMCLVLDHLLCPASGAAVVASERRRHCGQTAGRRGADLLHQEGSTERASRAGAAGALRIEANAEPGFEGERVNRGCDNEATLLPEKETMRSTYLCTKLPGAWPGPDLRRFIVLPSMADGSSGWLALRAPRAPPIGAATSRTHLSIPTSYLP